jgi:hypothetical protein
VLHRLLTSWEDALSKPAAPLFAAAADAVGKPPAAPAPAAPPKPALAAAAAPPSPADAAAAAQAAAAARAEQDAVREAAEAAAQAAAEAAAASEAAAWTAHASAAASTAAADAERLSLLSLLPAAPAYLSRLSPLCARLGSVLGSALAAGGPSRAEPALALHEACDRIAARSAALRHDASAGKPLKKKALTDLLHYLRDAGVSLRRSGVPAADREPVAWLLAPAVDASPALDSPGSPWQPAAWRHAWARSDGGYFRNCARLQALWGVNGSGVWHADVSPREAECGRFAVEHLLFLQRSQREALRAQAEAQASLSASERIAASLGGDLGSRLPPPAAAAHAWLLRVEAALCGACGVAEESLLLLKLRSHLGGSLQLLLEQTGGTRSMATYDTFTDTVYLAQQPRRRHHSLHARLHMGRV